jgi:beta-alanine--pyruvate transaminase
MVGAVDLAPRAEGVGKRGYEAIERAFHEEGLMIRTAGDTIAFSPPLIISESQVEELVEKLRRVIRAVAG